LARESHLFPWQHLVTASLTHSDQAETLRLTFSLQDIEIKWRNRRGFLALQDFSVKWIRAVPEHYHC
jgi:hypothetical protein